MANQPKAMRWMARALVPIVLLGALGHFYFWYWPRFRPAAPSPTSEIVGLVMGETGLDVRVWIPYPHQNLGALERRLDGLDSILVALGRLLGSAPLGLPSFGPFQVPPAREMAVATDFSGQEFVAAARVYPVAAWLFRAAGWLAGNPWMAGGELTLRGRLVRVKWQGNIWWAATDASEGHPREVDLAVGECSALLRLSRRLGPVPSGLFRFDASGNRLLLTSDLVAQSETQRPKHPLQTPGVALSWARITTAAEAARSIQSWIVLSATEFDRGGLPPVMVLQAGGSETLELPGERFLKALGAQVFRESRGAWEWRAYDQESLALGGGLIAPLEALSAMVETETEVSMGFVDLNEARESVLEVGRALQQVPVIGEAEARTWLAMARLLEGLTDYSTASIWLAEPQRIELEIRQASVD